MNYNCVNTYLYDSKTCASKMVDQGSLFVRAVFLGGRKVTAEASSDYEISACRKVALIAFAVLALPLTLLSFALLACKHCTDDQDAIRELFLEKRKPLQPKLEKLEPLPKNPSSEPAWQSRKVQVSIQGEPREIEEYYSKDVSQAPKISDFAWGWIELNLDGIRRMGDVILAPGTARQWHWKARELYVETGPHTPKYHSPGITRVVLENLVTEFQATDLVISRGVDDQLPLKAEAEQYLKSLRNQVTVHHEITYDKKTSNRDGACRTYNRLIADGQKRVVGLFHMTC